MLRIQKIQTKAGEAAERQLNNPGPPHKASVGVGSGCEGTQRQGHLSGLGKDIHPVSMSGRNLEGHGKGQLVQRLEFRETGRWEGMEHVDGERETRAEAGRATCRAERWPHPAGGVTWWLPHDALNPHLSLLIPPMEMMPYQVSGEN